MLPARRSIRIRNFNYSQNGYYFVTVCAKNMQCLFGSVITGQMHINDLGRIVMAEWQRTATCRHEVRLDEYVIMPNHFHGILILQSIPGTARRAPTRETFGGPVQGSVPSIVRAFKAAACRRINNHRATPGKKVWQRNYWEHVIRNESQLNAIREYVRNNPRQWELDRL